MIAYKAQFTWYEVHSTHPVNTEDGYAMIFLPFRVKPVVKPLETVAGAKEPAWTWASICGKCTGLSFALANYIIPSQLLPQKQALPLLNHAKEWSLMKRISWTKHKLPKPKHKYWWLFLLHCQQDEATVVRNVNPCRALVISLRMSPVVFSDLLKGLDDKSKDQFTSSYNKLQSPIANFNSCDYCLLFSYWQRHFLFLFFLSVWRLEIVSISLQFIDFVTSQRKTSYNCLRINCLLNFEPFLINAPLDKTSWRVLSCRINWTKLLNTGYCCLKLQSLRNWPDLAEFWFVSRQPLLIKVNNKKKNSIWNLIWVTLSMSRVFLKHYRHIYKGLWNIHKAL